jgi:hypothetical protein
MACRWCGERLVFARFTPPGSLLERRIPLEGPSRLNGVYIIQLGVARRLSSLAASEARDEGYDLYAYHECPRAPRRYRRRLAER